MQNIKIFLTIINSLGVWILFVYPKFVSKYFFYTREIDSKVRPSVDFCKPRDDQYTVSPIDIKFIKAKFVNPKKNSNDAPKTIFLTERSLTQFEKLITHFENIEFGTFQEELKQYRLAKLRDPIAQIQRPVLKHQPISKLLNPKIKEFNSRKQLRIFRHWRKRLDMLNRPLVRKYWKLIFERGNGFQLQNSKRIAFAKWPVDNRVKRIPSKRRKFISGEDQKRSLQEFLMENKRALALVKMVAQRERLKLEKLKLEHSQVWAEMKLKNFSFGRNKIRESEIIHIKSNSKVKILDRKTQHSQKSQKKLKNLMKIESTAENSPDPQIPPKKRSKFSHTQIQNQICKIKITSKREADRTKNLIRNVNQKVLGIRSLNSEDREDIDLYTYYFNLMEQMFEYNLLFDTENKRNSVFNSKIIQNLKKQGLKNKISQINEMRRIEKKTVERFLPRMCDDQKKISKQGNYFLRQLIQKKLSKIILKCRE